MKNFKMGWLGNERLSDVVFAYSVLYDGRCVGARNARPDFANFVKVEFLWETLTSARRPKIPEIGTNERNERTNERTNERGSV